MFKQEQGDAILQKGNGRKKNNLGATGISASGSSQCAPCVRSCRFFFFSGVLEIRSTLDLVRPFVSFLTRPSLPVSRGFSRATSLASRFKIQRIRKRNYFWAVFPNITSLWTHWLCAPFRSQENNLNNNGMGKC